MRKDKSALFIIFCETGKHPGRGLFQQQTSSERVAAVLSAVSAVRAVVAWSATSADDTQPCLSFKSLLGYHFPCSFTSQVAQSGELAPVLHNDEAFRYKRDKSRKQFMPLRSNIGGRNRRMEFIKKKCYCDTFFLEVGCFVFLMSLKSVDVIRKNDDDEEAFPRPWRW